MYKEDDVKIARVTFPSDFKFEMPDVTVSLKVKEGKEETVDEQATSELDEAKKKYQQSLGKHVRHNRRGAPNFFGL